MNPEEREAKDDEGCEGENSFNDFVFIFENFELQ
jgi:hypothetical protein